MLKGKISAGIFCGAVLLAGLGLSACSKHSPNPPGTVTYKAPADGFSCVIPGDWRALENQAGSLATFLGPPDGLHPNSATIAVYHYLKSDFSGPEDYYQRESVSASSAGAMVQEDMGRSMVYFFSLLTREHKIHSTQTQVMQEEDYLFPAKDGFYALVYMSPQDAVPESESVFRALVQSFKTP